MELAALERLKIPIDTKWLSCERSLPFGLLVLFIYLTKGINARDLKLDQLIGNDELVTIISKFWSFLKFDIAI